MKDYLFPEHHRLTGAYLLLNRAIAEAAKTLRERGNEAADVTKVVLCIGARLARLCDIPVEECERIVAAAYPLE